MSKTRDHSAASPTDSQGPAIPVALGVIAWIPTILFYAYTTPQERHAVYDMWAALEMVMAAGLSGCVALLGCAVSYFRLRGTHRSRGVWWPLALLLNYGLIAYWIVIIGGAWIGGMLMPGHLPP